MQDQFQGRDDRYGKTIRKNLTLTQEAIEAIEAYADRHNLYFSVAVETLAMMALGRETAETLPRLTANLLERLMLWQFNRFATLMAETIAVTEAVNFKTDFLIMQTLWREARLDPQGFTEKMLVSCQPDIEPDNQVRRLHEELKETAQQAGWARLKTKKAWLANDLAHEGGGVDE
jgi:hypothetical protein